MLDGHVRSTDADDPYLVRVAGEVENTRVLGAPSRNNGELAYADMTWAIWAYVAGRSWEDMNIELSLSRRPS